MWKEDHPWRVASFCEVASRIFKDHHQNRFRYATGGAREFRVNLFQTEWGPVTLSGRHHNCSVFEIQRGWPYEG